MDKRQTILIVDDAEFNRDILKDILGENYNYLEAENGNQAIQMIGDNLEIDLMLLDINMPQMNGFEVLAIMKRSRCLEETPVIMISSEESVDTMRKAYEMGITDYITRPFDSVIVKKRVQNTLGLYANQKHLINVVYNQVYEKEENNNIMIRILSNVLGSRNSESRDHILHIKTVTELMLRQLVKITDAYPMTEVDIALITTASSLHDIGKIYIPERACEQIRRESDRLEEQIRELIENVKEKKKKALEIAESLYLTCSYEVFKEAKRAAEEYGRHLISLIAAHEMFLRSLEYLKERKEHLEDLDADMEQIRYDLFEIQKEIRRKTEEQTSIQEQLRLTDYEEIKDRLDACIKWLQAYPENCVCV